MRFSDSSTSILFVYMYFLASCIGTRASSGVASYFSIAFFLKAANQQVFGKLGKFIWLTTLLRLTAWEIIFIEISIDVSSDQIRLKNR